MEVQVGGLGAINLGVKKELPRNLGSLQFAWTDVLRTVHINTYYGTLTEEAFAIKNHVSIHTESNAATVIRLTYTKSFGSDVKTRTAGAREEGDRIRKE